jgi:hypothetical protein
MLNHSIVRQNNTWSRLLITLDVFENICSAYPPCTYFVDFVQAFGYREDDDSKMRSGYRWKAAHEQERDGNSVR